MLLGRKKTTVSSLHLLKRLVSDLRVQPCSCILDRLRIDLSQVVCDVELIKLKRSV